MTRKPQTEEEVRDALRAMFERETGLRPGEYTGQDFRSWARMTMSPVKRLPAATRLPDSCRNSGGHLTYPAAGCDWRLRQGNISYVHDLDSDRTFTIGAEFEYPSGSRGKPDTNSPPRELTPRGVNYWGGEFAYATGARDFIRTNCRALNNPRASRPDGCRARGA
jgi:hypothetical protein